jgi:hypothetical protein
LAESSEEGYGLKKGCFANDDDGTFIPVFHGFAFKCNIEALHFKMTFHIPFLLVKIKH